MFNQPYDNENSYGPTYGLHREALEFGRDEYVELQRYAKELGLTFFATAFDFKSADFLEALDIPAYKLASQSKSLPLLRYVASFSKNRSSLAREAVPWRMFAGCRKSNSPHQFPIGHPSMYGGIPSAFEELELSVISTFRREFPNATIGFSSHDSGIAMAVAAYVLGARVVEKHFTLNRAMKGTDHAFSLEPVGLKKMVRDLQRVRLAMGTGVKHTFASEQKPLLKMGKKLVAARPLAAGQILKAADIALKSPSNDLPPYELERLVGKTLSKPMIEDQEFTLEIVSDRVTA